MQGQEFPSLTRVLDQLFENIRQNPASLRHSLTNDQLLSLHFFFDKLLPRALQVVESRSVRCFIASHSRRRLFQVQGSQAADLYTVFPKHFCSCQAFIHSVVGRKESIYCKHQLAARIADALRLCPVIEVSDEALAQQLIAV